MYLKSGDEYLDTDLYFLENILTMLDAKLFEINKEIDEALNKSSDPDSLGLFDKGDYLVGMGLVACQKYLSSTFGSMRIDKQTALKIGPHVNCEPVVAIINAAANCWKHSDEWNHIEFISEPESEMLKVNIRNHNLLNKQETRTVKVIEKVTPWADYTCANILFSLTNSDELKLMELIPTLIEWRNQLDILYQGEY